MNQIFAQYLEQRLAHGKHSASVSRCGCYSHSSGNAHSVIFNSGSFPLGLADVHIHNIHPWPSPDFPTGYSTEGICCRLYARPGVPAATIL